MNSLEMKKKRSYCNSSEFKYVWTKEDIDSFFIAFEKFGNSPTANRSIAKFMGKEVHPRHVVYFKSLLRKTLRILKKNNIKPNDIQETMNNIVNSGKNFLSKKKNDNSLSKFLQKYSNTPYNKNKRSRNSKTDENTNLDNPSNCNTYPPRNHPRKNSYSKSSLTDDTNVNYNDQLSIPILTRNMKKKIQFDVQDYGNVVNLEQEEKEISEISESIENHIDEEQYFQEISHQDNKLDYTQTYTNFDPQQINQNANSNDISFYLNQNTLVYDDFKEKGEIKVPSNTDEQTQKTNQFSSTVSSNSIIPMPPPLPPSLNPSFLGEYNLQKDSSQVSTNVDNKNENKNQNIQAHPLQKSQNSSQSNPTSQQISHQQFQQQNNQPFISQFQQQISQIQPQKNVPQYNQLPSQFQTNISPSLNPHLSLQQLQQIQFQNFLQNNSNPSSFAHQNSNNRTVPSHNNPHNAYPNQQSNQTAHNNQISQQNSTQSHLPHPPQQFPSNTSQSNSSTHQPFPTGFFNNNTNENKN